MIKRIIRTIRGRLITFLNRPLKHFAHIGAYTRFSKRYIMLTGTKYIYIGDAVHICPHVRIEAIDSHGSQRFSPSIVIEDRVSINQNFHCTCAESVHIGKGTSITANCGIFDIIHPHENISKNPRVEPLITKPVFLGEDCLIGMNSVILPGAKLGDHVIVGANSTVREGIYPSFCVLAGSPAKIIKQYNQAPVGEYLQ